MSGHIQSGLGEGKYSAMFLAGHTKKIFFQRQQHYGISAVSEDSIYKKEKNGLALGYKTQKKFENCSITVENLCTVHQTIQIIALRVEAGKGIDVMSRQTAVITCG